MNLGSDMRSAHMSGLGPLAGLGHGQQQTGPGTASMVDRGSWNHRHHPSPPPPPPQSAPELESHLGAVKRPRERRRPAPHAAKERRSRTIFNYAQLDALERIFLDVEYPDGDLKAKIAERLDVDEGTIQIWFQNRRAKKKRLQRGQPAGSEPPHHGQVSASDHGLLETSIPHSQNCNREQPLQQQQHQYQHQYAPQRAMHPASFPTGASAHLYRQEDPYRLQDRQLIPSAGHDEQRSEMLNESWIWRNVITPDNQSPPLRDLRGDILAHGTHNSYSTSNKNLPPDFSPKSCGSETQNAFLDKSSELLSPEESNGGLLEKIKKWPIKEPPTSRSSFGKLDFPRLPRVCIRHDNLQGRKSSDSVSKNDSPRDRRKDAADRDILALRQKILKKDLPKSPPPNQTCAAIPRSQRNELELALMKHGLSDDPVSDAGSIGRDIGDFRSEEWSSSSEESSDSEGLAPPRRRRKVVRDRRPLPPNRNCTTVPLSDRTLPFCQNVAVGNILPRKSPVANGESDWDTDSDDSSWAYFDPVEERRKAGASEVESHVNSERKYKENTSGPELEKNGPRSAPAALEADEIPKTDILPLDDKCDRLSTKPTDDNDELSEIALAREFNEMLPSPFGIFLPAYTENKSSSNHCNSSLPSESIGNRRPRILSDSALMSTTGESGNISTPDAVTKSKNDHADGSPSSVRSTESALSGLSTLLGLPVSPNELVSSLSDAQLDPPIACDVIGSSEQDELVVLQQPVSECSKHEKKTFPLAPQHLAIKSRRDQQNGLQHPYISNSSHHSVNNGFNTERTDNFTNNAPISGVVRPVPTHPFQEIPRHGATSFPASTMQSTTGSRMFPDRTFQRSEYNQTLRYPQNYGPFRAGVNANASRDDGSGNAPCFQQYGYSHGSISEVPASVVHYQPSSGMHQAAGTQHKGRLPQISHNSSVLSPSARSSPFQSPTGMQLVATPSPPPNANLPPNQVCTAVPDAVSSEGLMARYLAWTQGRVV